MIRYLTKKKNAADKWKHRVSLRSLEIDYHGVKYLNVTLRATDWLLSR